MHSGMLRHRVEIHELAREPSGTADAQETSRLVAVRFAAISTVKGSERIDGVNAGAGPTHRVTVRFDDQLFLDLQAGFYVETGGRRFAIRDIEHVDEARVWIDLLCEEDRSA